jgi:hypothetical protein
MMTDFRNDLVTAAFDAFSGTAVAGTDTNIDFKIDSDNTLISGASLMCDAKLGDYASCHVVDVDNILSYGAGFVVSTFVKKAFIDGHVEVSPGYASLIPRGLYIRVTYHNTDSTDKEIFINLHLHTRK